MSADLIAPGPLIAADSSLPPGSLLGTGGREAQTRYPTLTILPGRHKRLLGGHPWLYSNEVAMDAAAKARPPGSLVRLRSSEGRSLGIATFNPHALIAARLLDRSADATVDRAFLEARFARALTLRDRLYDQPFYRLIHAEADGLPGLVVDRYGDALSVQVNSAGMALLEETLLEALDAVLKPQLVMLRNDSAARTLEGLDRHGRIWRGAVEGAVSTDAVPLSENGARFFADLGSGQKTGWFFDQRENRADVAALAAGRTMLDLYCFAGGFGTLAAVKGAAAVTFVDRSDQALALAQRAVEANGITAPCRFERTDAFDFLEKSEEVFDIVVADPPAFAKSKKDVGPALQGYRKLARFAASRVAPGGVLFIASCSHNINPEAFADSVRRGLVDTGRTARILRSSGAAADHPVHPALPESAYLKAQLLALD